MYKIKIRKQVAQFINSRPAKEKKAIAEALIKLLENPYQNTLDIKKMKSSHNKYRL